MAITELGIKQNDGSYTFAETGADAANIDFTDGETLADKASDWDAKQDSETGKGLSTNDYSDAYKNKLSGAESGANENVIESLSLNDTPLTPDSNKNVNVAIPQPSDLAPENHASTSTTYGIATRENYGHAKFGTTAGTAIQANDSRLTDDRTPTTHASASASYGLGSDVNYGHIKVVDATSSLNTDTAAAASAHSVYQGLLGKCDDLDYDSETFELSLLRGNTVLSTAIIDSTPKSELVVTVDDDLLYGETITCSITSPDTETLTATVPNTGLITFNLKYEGTYTISCGGYSTTVTNSTAGDTLNATLHVAKTTVTLSTTTQEWYSSIATVSKNGSQAGTIQLTNGVGTIKLYETGTYIITLEGKTSTLVLSSLDTTENVSINNIDLVSWSSGTDAQIKTMIDAYYDGSITLNDVKSVWSVGDVRTMHFNSMTAPNGSSGTWDAQNIQIVILDFDHTELATAINGKTKALITVQTKECMNNNSEGYNQSGHIYVNGDSAKDTSFTKWSSLYMRTYLNNTVLAAIPSGDFKSAIKPSKHYRHTTYNGSTSEEVTDTLFLPSYPEIFGTESYSSYAVTSPVEGTQFKYYETQSNRIKYGNNNGASNGVTQYWWEGSASSYYNSSAGYAWCNVTTDGSAANSRGGNARGLAPAFAM